MAFSIHHYGSIPQWGVVLNTNPFAQGAAIITSATFTTSTQKYEAVNQLGHKIGALFYDAECAFSIQATLFSAGTTEDEGCDLGPAKATTDKSPVFAGCSQPCGFQPASTIAGLVTMVSVPAWVFGSAAGGLVPLIDSVEFSMSNTDARSLSLSGTIYEF